MAVTLYRQVGKAKAGATSRSIWVRGAALPISPVPISCGTRSLTVPVRGSTLATTSTRRSPPASANRHTSKLSTQSSGHSEPRRNRSDENHGRRVSVVRCASALQGKDQTRQEREDAGGVQLPSWIFLRLHGAAESYGLFLHSGIRDAEMQNTEYADFNREKCTLHVQPKPWRHLRLEGQKEKEVVQGQIHPNSRKAGLEDQRRNARLS